MNYKDMFDKQLISLEVEGESEEKVFETVAAHLKALGFVNDGYLKALPQEKNNFPLD